MDERTPDPWLTDGSLRRRWPLACISSTPCSTARQRHRLSAVLFGGGSCLPKVMVADTRRQALGTNRVCCSLIGGVGGEKSVDFHQNPGDVSENFYGRGIFRSFPDAVQ